MIYNTTFYVQTHRQLHLFRKQMTVKINKCIHILAHGRHMHDERDYAQKWSQSFKESYDTEFCHWSKKVFNGCRQSARTIATS